MKNPLKLSCILLMTALLVSGCVSAASSTDKTAKARPAPEKKKIGDYHVLTFDKLAAFKYEVPDDPITDPKAKAILEKNQIPKSIRKFDKQKVAVT
ncbi:uncharacterized protein METZ01_LOCUS407593, partial [marine metagenome]